MHRTTSGGCCGCFYPPCGLYEMLSRTHDAHAWRVPPIKKPPHHPHMPVARYFLGLYVEGHFRRNCLVASGLQT